MSIYKTDYPPISKTFDPDTSKIAEQKYNVKSRGKRLRQVLELIADYPGKTGGEYGMLFQDRYPDLPALVALDTPRKRISDLRQMGLVDRLVKKTCPHTGQLAWTHSVTGHGLRLLRSK